MLRLPVIARAAECLCVLLNGQAARANRNFVVKREIMSSSATSALVAKPITTLSRREIGCAALTLFAVLAVLARLQSPQAAPVSGNAFGLTAGLSDISREHAFLAIDGSPAELAVDSFAKQAGWARLRSVDQSGFKSLLPTFFGAKSTATIIHGGLWPVENSSAGFARKGVTPARLLDDEAIAMGLSGAFTGAALYLGPSPRGICHSGRELPECLSAVNALEVDFWHVIPSQLNQGEFGGTQGLNVSLSGYLGNTERSRACSREARGAERVETRLKGNSEPTSALHRSNDEEIVRSLPSQARGKEDGYKQPIGNTEDSGFDTLNINASDVLTSAQYEWVQSAINVVSSGRELRMNSGREQIISLAAARTKNAMRTASNYMSIDIYSSGALANQMGGLAAIITTDGTGTVGGINSGTYTFWANQYRECSGTNTVTKANIKEEMNALWYPCVRGNDKPDLIVFSQDFYGFYEASLQDLQRWTNNEGANAATAGFNALKYKSADVIFDSNSNFGTTAERGYFINSDYLELVVHRDANWTTMDEKASVNQDGVVIPVLWMGQMVCSNRARQGIIIDAG